MAKKTRHYFPQVADATALLGLQIREARISRRWTLAGLAERAGISPNTLAKVERGDPTVGIGIVFDCASLVGIELFHHPSDRHDDPLWRGELRHMRDRIHLIPQRVRRVEIDDDF